MEKTSGNYASNLQAIQYHLAMLQSLIQRMASNSAAAKTWCITVVSAILVFIIDKGIPQYALLGFIPVISFCALDAYYLALERRFIKAYNVFVIKWHNRDLKLDDLFIVEPQGSAYSAFFSSFYSFSIWLFYFAISGMVFAVNLFFI